MNSSETGLHYDQIALWYQANVPETYGMAQLQRALRFVPSPGPSLDVGCGSQGRFLKHLIAQGFTVEGMDISTEMIALARERCPNATLHLGDIFHWTLPRTYNFISAWDSTFHLPLEEQEPVLRKLCAGLELGGVLLFTCGGGEAGEISGSFAGQDFEYSTLGVESFVSILQDADCFCRHVEYDQYPEKHVSIIAERKSSLG